MQRLLSRSPHLQSRPQPNNKDFVAISISGKEALPANAILYCSCCKHQRLDYISAKDSDNGLAKFYCSRCNIFLYPQKDKIGKPSKFSTPGPKTVSHGNITGDRTPLISTVEHNDSEDASSVYKEPKIPTYIYYDLF